MTNLDNKQETKEAKAEVIISHTSKNQGIKIHDLESAYRIAYMVIKAGLAPKSLVDGKNAEQQAAAICAVLLMGVELGLPPMQSLQGIACINGQLAVWGDTALAMCRNSGLMKTLKETPLKDKDGKNIGWKCFSQHINGDTAEHEFTLENKPNKNGKFSVWDTEPLRMCQMRARSRTLRDLYSNVLRGMYTADEAMDFIDTSKPTPEITTVTHPSLLPSKEEDSTINPALLTKGNNSLEEDLAKDAAKYKANLLQEKQELL